MKERAMPASARLLARLFATERDGIQLLRAPDCLPRVHLHCVIHGRPRSRNRCSVEKTKSFKKGMQICKRTDKGNLYTGVTASVKKP